MGLCWEHSGDHSATLSYHTADLHGGATALTFQQDIWIWRCICSLFPSNCKCGDDHRTSTRDRDSIAVLQLRGILLMVVYYSAFYFYKAGFEKTSDIKISGTDIA